MSASQHQAQALGSFWRAFLSCWNAPTAALTHTTASTKTAGGKAGRRQWSLLRHRAWQAGWCQHIGARHARLGVACEDNLGLRFTAAGGIHAVAADGVSGGACGDVASASLVEYAIDLKVKYPPPPSRSGRANDVSAGDQLRDQLAQADTKVRQALNLCGNGRSGACTFSAVWIDENGLGWVSRAGDCRVYHWRPISNEKTSLPLSTSASVQLQLALPDQSYAELCEVPPPGVPLHNPARMCGNGHMGEPELRPVALMPGDGMLLCSDGVHDVLGDDALSQLLAKGVRRKFNPLRLAHSIERQARQKGSEDDIAVMVLRFEPTTSTS